MGETVRRRWPLLLSVVLPTIPGRGDELERTIATYERLTPVAIEWIIERGHTNAGAAWNAGVARATGDILHITADDLEPETAGWLPAALTVIAAGGVPLGWVYEHTNRFGRDFCRVPACRREWWRDVPEIHYFSDNIWTDWMVRDGHPPTVADGFDFVHRRSMVGRHEAEWMARDRAVYQSLQ